MMPINREDVNNFLVFGTINEYRYRNWRDEVELRRFIPIALRFGRSPYFKEEKWVIEVFDCDRNALRTYALDEIEPR